MLVVKTKKSFFLLLLLLLLLVLDVAGRHGRGELAVFPFVPLRDGADELSVDVVDLLLEVLVGGDRVVAVDVGARLGGFEVELVGVVFLLPGLLPQTRRLALQKLLAQSVGTAPRQLAHVLQPVGLAPQHRVVDAGLW